MGFEQYQEAYARQLTEMARLKARRKQHRAVERILNPEISLERKERRKKIDRLNRKRAHDDRKGRIAVKMSKCEGDEVARVNREAEPGNF